MLSQVTSATAVYWHLLPLLSLAGEPVGSLTFGSILK